MRGLASLRGFGGEATVGVGRLRHSPTKGFLRKFLMLWPGGSLQFQRAQYFSGVSSWENGQGG